MKRTPRVLVVATSRKTRGGITAVLNTYKRTDFWNKFNCYWIETHRDGSQLRKLFYFISGLMDYIVRIPFYDLVHIHISLQITTQRKKLFVAIAKMLRKKIVVHLHCGTQIDDVWNNNYEYIFRNADAGIMLSQSILNKVQEKLTAPCPLYVCFNPCPKVSFEDKEVSGKKRYILFSGTLCDEKGYLDLIRAFAQVSDYHPEWKLVLAGVGEIAKGERLASELGISQQVEFPGWIGGIVKDQYYREASIFCLPSYAEGFPMAVLDAFAYGLPVVTTPVGGIPDVAVDGENMLLFNPGDVAKLSENLRLLIENEELRVKLCIASKNLAQNQFNIENVLKQVSDIYSEI